MISAPSIKVTCDNCVATTYVRPVTHSVPEGLYDCQTKVVERELIAEGWVIIDGKHYCGSHCAKSH